MSYWEDDHVTIKDSKGNIVVDKVIQDTDKINPSLPITQGKDQVTTKKADLPNSQVSKDLSENSNLDQSLNSNDLFSSNDLNQAKGLLKIGGETGVSDTGLTSGLPNSSTDLKKYSNTINPEVSGPKPKSAFTYFGSLGTSNYSESLSKYGGTSWNKSRKFVVFGRSFVKDIYKVNIQYVDTN